MTKRSSCGISTRRSPTMSRRESRHDDGTAPPEVFTARAPCQLMGNRTDTSGTSNAWTAPWMRSVRFTMTCFRMRRMHSHTSIRSTTPSRFLKMPELAQPAVLFDYRFAGGRAVESTAVKDSAMINLMRVSSSHGRSVTISTLRLYINDQQRDRVDLDTLLTGDVAEGIRTSLEQRGGTSSPGRTCTMSNRSPLPQPSATSWQTRVSTGSTRSRSTRS